MNKPKEISTSNVIEQLKTSLEVVSRVAKKMNWEDPNYYACWLSQTFHYTKHSTRTLSAAASRFGLDRDFENMQLIDHAKEERSHEKLAINDIKVLGYSPEIFPELPETRRIYQCIFYQIDRESPASIFGYTFFLESLSVGAGTIVSQKIKNAFGSKALSYLKIHTEDDVDHLKRCEPLIERFKSTKDLHSIKDAIEMTGKNYASFLYAIGDYATQLKINAA